MALKVEETAHKFWDFDRCSCRNFGTCIITLTLPQVLYVVMDRSGTTVRSTRVRSRTSRWVIHSPMRRDGYAYVLGLRVVLYTTLRRPSTPAVAAAWHRARIVLQLSVVLAFRCFCRMCPICALRACGWWPQTVMLCVRPLCILNRQFQHQHFGLHEEVEV